MSLADNFTDFAAGSRFVFQMAVEEYHTGRNWSGLLDRYWLIVEELIAGKSSKGAMWVNFGGVEMLLQIFVVLTKFGPRCLRTVQNAEFVLGLGLANTHLLVKIVCHFSFGQGARWSAAGDARSTR